jgi:ribosome maturation factor RimP
LVHSEPRERIGRIRQKADKQRLNSKNLKAGGKAAGPHTAQDTRKGGGKGRAAGVDGAARDGFRTPRPPREPRPVPEGERVGWREAINATVAGLGFDLVDVERAPRGLLRITIDRQAGRTYAMPSDFVLVEDCEQVTRQLQYALEVEGLDYSRLEVSSPGLDRPLKTEADYERFSGEAVNIVLKTPFQGRKNWQGVLQRAVPEAAATEPAEAAEAAAPVSGWQLVFKQGKAEQVLGFNFDEVREARLVPVVDFKGRKPRSDAAAGEQAGEAPDAAAAPGTDGG